MSMNGIVLASHNKGKLRELAEMLSPLGIELRSAGDLSLPEPEETGSTFHENAELKAVAARDVCGQTCLADDSGLVIPALDGAPGIYSARYKGDSKTYDVAFERIQKELAEKGVTDPHPKAYFVCVLCLAEAGGPVHYFEGQVHGRLTFPPQGEHGFGYDPIFIPDGHKITFGEMDPVKKNAMSHRAHASQAFLQFLQGQQKLQSAN